MTKFKSSLKSAGQLKPSNSSKGSLIFGYYKWVVILVSLIVISLISFGIYHLISLSGLNTSSSLTQGAKDRLLIKRDDLDSTLIVIEGSDNLKIQGAWYVVTNNRNGSSVVYFIPPGVYMKDYLKKVSEFVSVGDLKYLGDSLDQERSIEYAIWQLGNLTGITPDSYIWVGVDSLKSFSNIYGDIGEYTKADYSKLYKGGDSLTLPSFAINSLFDKYNLFGSVIKRDDFTNYITGIDSNLSGYDLYSRFNSLKSALDTGNSEMLDLGQIWATSEIIGVTGRNINLVNYTQVDSRLGEVIKELKGRDIEREQVRIEVYNGSGIEGLASRYSRKFGNAGVEVVRFENAPSDIEKSTIYIAKPDIYPKSLALVQRLLYVDSQVISNRPDFMTTGDIVVILGKDLIAETQWK